ncbi:maleylpyruvate isomerase family mycothiol-dependent enzyme [Cryobacterium adonitolivorans]|uniref:Maleylpyruvate isomerase family mycothiol-dependent enzyme n=1 Tax=Cryobacterium adonitolivorans TaxID=1259189 RepID=A0A4R8W0K3_9MICO|nr:maleylpyruvate isomerase family mycothiol-dependent enzyme [Cryobacterium adonitolivorans]TFB99776.1 maleylpyruvate isomerase family mycothiol-dependent enzyme [Cryobacterium adonitolivorans]
MADFARLLPLSLRSVGNESGVNARWSGHLAATLTAIADLLAGLTPEQWEAQSLCTGWRVRDVAGHLVWRLGSTKRELVGSATRAYVGHFVRPARAIDVVSRAAASAEPEQLVARLREIAAAKATTGRGGIVELTEAVVHGLDVAHPLGLTLPIHATAGGAVALRRSLIAPTEITAVLRTRRLVATDAEWSVGHGEPLRGQASELILFLFGRGPLPAGAPTVQAPPEQPAG